MKFGSHRLTESDFDLTSHFLADGGHDGHDVISRRKVLPPGE